MRFIEVAELGVLPHLWIIPAIFAALSVIAIAHGLWFAASDMEYPLWVAPIAGAAAIIMGIVWIFVPIPYDSKYWSYYSVEGTVESVSNGFAEGDGDVTYRSFVVEFVGDDRPYVLTDPRITSLDGQDVTLLCTISWEEWGWAADKWECSIRDAGYVQ